MAEKFGLGILYFHSGCVEIGSKGICDESVMVLPLSKVILYYFLFKTKAGQVWKNELRRD